MKSQRHIPSLLRPVGDPAEVRAAVRLLAEGGWTATVLDEWATTGTVLVMFDPAEDTPLGAAIVRAAAFGAYELLAWATPFARADPDISIRLIGAVRDALRALGARRVVVNTTDLDADRQALLLECGFQAKAGCERRDDQAWADQDL